MVDYSPTSIKPFNYYSHADYWHTFKKSINVAWYVCWKNSVFVHEWQFCYARCIRSKRLSPEVMKFLTASWLLVLIGIIMHQEKFDAVDAIVWKEPDIFFTSERQFAAVMFLIWWIIFSSSDYFEISYQHMTISSITVGCCCVLSWRYNSAVISIWPIVAASILYGSSWGGVAQKPW